MTEQLKSCPFCDGAAHFDHDDDGWNWIECAGCGVATNAMVSAMDDCKPILAERWNRRASQQVPEGHVIVPKEPTKEMITADPYGMGYGRLNAIYRAMLAAAPSAQSTGEKHE